MSRRLKPELELITASKLTPHTILLRIHVMREYDTLWMFWIVRVWKTRFPAECHRTVCTVLQCMGEGEDKTRSCWYNSLEDQNYANNWQMLRSPRLSLHTVGPDTKSLKHFLAKTSYCKTLYTTRFTYLLKSLHVSLSTSFPIFCCRYFYCPSAQMKCFPLPLPHLALPTVTNIL